MTTKRSTTDMSGITVVEFENAVHSEETYLSSELADGPPFVVHGVALGNGDVTKGKSGIKKKWPAEELEKAAESLQGTNLVIDHENSVHGVVGRVTKAGYKDDKGVVYEAELYDEDLAEKVQKGLLEVSVRGLHKDVDDLDEEKSSEALVVEDIEFKNLSVVPSGAAPSNTLEMGENAELSAAELSAFTEGLEAAELAEIEPGMWVQWGENRGITISQIEDGEIEVDLYEQDGDQWRSKEETTMVPVDDLSEWDVDEDKIGAAPEKDEEDDSPSDEEENVSDGDELVSVDDKVQWEDGAAQGVVVERKTEGCFNERIDGDVEVCAGDDEAAVLIEIVKQGERTGTMVAHKEGTLNSADFSLAADEENQAPDPPEWEEGDMVQWQVAPSMKGRIVHVPSNQDIVMVEVMQEKDGEMVETGFTVSAGYSDIVPMENEESEDDGEEQSEPESDEEESRSEEENADIDSDATVSDLIAVLSSVVENASTSKDVPTEDAEPDHQPMGSMENMFNQFMEDGGSPDSTLKEFIEWLNENAELEAEGADNILNTADKVRTMKENDAAYMAFVWQDSDELAEGYDDYPEAAKENAQMALDAKEETDNPNDCGTDVGWKRANQLASGESLSRDTIAKMSAFNRHRSNSDMDDDEGRADCGWMMWKAWGGDEGVDWAQKKLDQIEEENSDSVELQDYEMHIPDWSGTTESDWSSPDMEDFDTDDLEEIAAHFLISATGFPPENFGDLKLPVVEPNGDLNVNALAAVKGGRGVSAVEGMSSEMEDEIVQWVNKTANDPDTFDRDWGADEEENSEELEMQFNQGDWVQWSWSGSTAYGKIIDTFDGEGTVTRTIDGTEVSKDSDEQPVYMVKVWDGDDFSGKALRQEGARSLQKWSNPPEEEAAEYEDVPEDHRFESEEDAMAMAEELDLEGVHEMEFDGETMYVPGETHEDYMDAISENSKHGYGKDEEEMAYGESTQPDVVGVRVLPSDDLQQMYGKSGESDADSLTQYKVTTMNEQIEEKLSELDDPVAVEGEELSTLQEKADRFEEMSENLEALRERTDILDDVSRDSVEELRDGEDPVVVESARYEELQGEAEQVKSVYAAQLSEHYDAFESDELADKFSIEELREKYEDQFGSIEELADSTQAEPQSQDPSEEELEEGSEEESSEEELSDEVAQRQEEIRSKLDAFGGN